METIKNFLAICVATTIFLFGIASVVGVGMLIESIIQINWAQTFEWILFTVATSLLCALGIVIGRRSERIKMAIEYPFTFI